MAFVLRAQKSRPLTVAAILLAMFLSAMEATVVATAMPRVIGDLRGLELYGWVGAIYMLAVTVTIPVWGKLADVLGRKPVMLAGLVLFLSGSLGCGEARSMEMLIGMRALQGVGAGALQPIALTIVGDIFTVEERARIQGVFGAVWGFSGMVGPLLGGFIVDALSWRWVFFINLPFGLLSAILLWLFYVEEREPGGARKPIDFAGASLLSLGVLSLLMGVGGRYPFFTLPVAALSLVAFIAVEKRAVDPLLPLTMLSKPVIRVASLLGSLMGSTMMATIMYTPLFVQAVLRGTPTEAGSSVAPMLVGWPIASALSGRLLPKVGYRPLVRGGLTLLAIGCVALYFTNGMGAKVLAPVTFLIGTGMGTANTALLISVQESVTHRERGVATASTMFFRNIGGALTVGALGALIAALLHGKLPEHTLDDLLGPEHGGNIAPALLAEYERFIAAAMKPVFQVIAALGVTTFVAGLMFPDVKMSKASQEKTAASPVVAPIE